jgi:hypothetical protein
VPEPLRVQAVRPRSIDQQLLGAVVAVFECGLKRVSMLQDQGQPLLCRRLLDAAVSFPPSTHSTPQHTTEQHTANGTVTDRETDRKTDSSTLQLSSKPKNAHKPAQRHTDPQTVPAAAYTTVPIHLQPTEKGENIHKRERGKRSKHDSRRPGQSPQTETH